MSRRCFHIRGAASALALLLCIAGAAVAAPDKSGVQPNTVSLPSGPGSIEGLGESFEPSLNTGTAKYGLGISVPPGAAGHTPSVGLAYEGGAGNGPLGFGWRLDVPCIKRQTDKGIPQYVDTNDGVDNDRDGVLDEMDERDVFVEDSGEELVPQSNGDFFCENEGAFIRYRRVDDGWEGALPDGSRMLFGTTPNSRVFDGDRTWSWLADTLIDTHGNEITLEYTEFSGDENLHQKYLSVVRYGPGAAPWTTAYHLLRFDYETRTDWFEDARPGFLVRTGMRLKEIIVATHGVTLPGSATANYDGDAVPESLVRKYVLAYEGDPRWSLLSSFTLTGADGTSTLPPTRFTYTQCNMPGTLSAAGAQLGALDEPPVAPDSALADLADLNGDALPDLLVTDLEGGAHSVYYNQGEESTGPGLALSWAARATLDSADSLAWSVNLESTDKIAWLSDMDGDGLADFTYRLPFGDVYYFRNTGAGGWGPSLRMSAQDDVPPAPFSNAHIETADIDFDKRIDIIESIPIGFGSADYRLWRNLGNQQYARAETVPQTAGLDFAQPGVEIADFNGDRVPDIARIQTNALTVLPGLGYARFAAPRTVAVPDYTFSHEDLSRAKLRDLNGDGLVDLLLEFAAPRELWYWINPGNYTLEDRRVITGLPGQYSPGAVVRWADMNGNGTTDLVLCDSDSEPRMQIVDIGRLLGCVPEPHLLKSIDNGIGGLTTIDYTTSTVFSRADAIAGQPWTDPLPFPVHIVHAVHNTDGLGNTYTKQFAYHRGYYDGAEKEFRGFAQVEVIEPGDATAPTLYTSHVFNTGNLLEVMKGKLLQQQARTEAGQLFWDETTAWEVRDLHTGTDGRFVRIAFPTKTTRDLLELGQGTPKRMESEFVFDDYGNQTEVREWGVVEGTDKFAGNDERISTTEYLNDITNWKLRYPFRGRLYDGHNTLLSQSQTFYDDPDFSADQPAFLDKGDPSLVRSWKDVNTPAAFVNSVRSRFDAYGNPVELLDPLAASTGLNTDDAQGHYRTLAYDTLFHAFPVSETVHIGGGSADLVIEVGYNVGLATVTHSVDFNGTNQTPAVVAAHTTSYRYDTFGRLTSILRPGDDTNYPSAVYAYHLAEPFGAGLLNYVETFALDKTPASLPAFLDHYLLSRVYVDGLGRQRLSKQEAEPTGGQPRVVLGGAALYHARAGVASALNPCYTTLSGTLLDKLAFEDIEAPGWQGSFEENGAITLHTLNTSPKSHMSYDALLRPLTSTNPDGSQGSITYEPLLTKTYDENDSDPGSPFHLTPMVHYLDGLGRLVQVDETAKLDDEGLPVADLRTWTTRYSYRADDVLTKIVDSQANEKYLEYDSLGRKTFMNDADRGHMTYLYDAASNLTETIDAKSQHIVYAYDGANRLLTENYAGMLVNGVDRVPDVAYHYDAPVADLDLGDNTRATATNLKGLLAWVEDLSGQEHQSYDDRGNLLYVVKRIPDPVTSAYTSYTTHMSYDPSDRVTALTYPDNDQARYEYNDRGLVERITGGALHNLDLTPFILKGTDTTPAGQLKQVQYGNGVVTNYAFDTRLRLSRLTTAREADPVNPLLDYAYTFDKASNITRIDDLRPATVHPEGDALRNTQIFGYDDLYRLTSVQYSFNLPGQPDRNDGEIHYRYDRIGNMLEAASPSMLDHIENGHSVTHLGLMHYGGDTTNPARPGARNRLGRAQGDPPGPHALTHVQGHATRPEDERSYPYDDNGNMTDIDGMDCTWDFKDRLVAVENDKMRAEYSYDYTDRRITKKVFEKRSVGVPPALPALPAFPTLTTQYINKYFEVREGRQPTKYVFHGETRVARIIGTLDPTKNRVQRIPIVAGWNLFGLAVDAADTEEQLGLNTNPSITAAYRWDAAAKTYEAIDDLHPLGAGDIVMLKVEAIPPQTGADTLEVLGTYVEPPDTLVVDPGTVMLNTKALMALHLDTALKDAAEYARIWGQYEQQWKTWFAEGSLSILRDVEMLPASDVVSLRPFLPEDLTLGRLQSRICFYLLDHLASTGSLIDSDGGNPSFFTNLPFGCPRSKSSSITPSHIWPDYRFVQKEDDLDTGLAYFEARYLANNIGRFASFDPAANAPGGYMLLSPIRLNPYAYGHSSPVTMVDRNGKSAALFGFALGFASGAYNAVKDGGGWQDAVVSGLISGGQGFLVGAAVDLTVATMGAASPLLVVVAAGAVGAGTGGFLGFVGEAGKVALLNGAGIKKLNGEEYKADYQKAIITGTASGLFAGVVGGVLKPGINALKAEAKGSLNRAQEMTFRANKNVVKTWGETGKSALKTLNSKIATQHKLADKALASYAQTAKQIAFEDRMSELFGAVLNEGVNGAYDMAVPPSGSGGGGGSGCVAGGNGTVSCPYEFEDDIIRAD